MTTTAPHEDVYAKDLGKGEPVYDAWVIEDDASGAHIAEDDLMESEKKGFLTPAGRPSSNELWRFRRRGCQDCWAAVFFIGLLAVTLVWGALEVQRLTLNEDQLSAIADNLGLDRIDFGAYYRRSLETTTAAPAEKAKGKEKDSTASPAPPVGDDGMPIIKSFVALRAGLELLGPLTGASELFSLRVFLWTGVALGGVFLGLALLETIPRGLITAECYVQTILFTFASGSFFTAGQLVAALVMLLLATLPLVWLYLVRDRIPFAVAMLTTTARILRRHKGLLIIGLLTSFVVVSYLMLSLLLTLPPLLRGLAGTPSDSDSTLLLLLLFAFFWFQQVMSNVTHVTISGVVATWYFAGEARLPPAPIRSSLGRSLSSSFGSICFGSLLVSIIRFFRFLVGASRSDDNDGLLTCVLDCILGCIEGIIMYFNEYAFVHVAIYGCSYVDGARRTWALAQQCFFAATFNDCLAGQAADMLNLLIAGGIGFVAAVLVWSIPFGVLLFCVSLFVNLSAFKAIQSSVTTIFVCYAELPEGLLISFPALHEELMRADGGQTAARQRDGYIAVSSGH
ncbi:hypothetical protein STCU_09074 [Strigomonas culicis]|uniref:Choline transporter-like protein n=1 Tax=Strigomonas culicis TaxID=28005 RepID=S9TUM8_9TRYP|nr:hypothetical protein STCU_09074 [Strigomonas culicis]|eukprot:EPY20269.1 hypothetical protein STCU_09074 [Strigomonas culicis]